MYVTLRSALSDLDDDNVDATVDDLAMVLGH
jgi:hypothetical protein